MQEFANMKVTGGLFLLFCVVGSAISLAIPEKITEDQLPKFFPIAGTTEPQFDIIRIESPKLHKRDLYGQANIRMKAFGEDINLWLRPLDGFLATANTPVYTIQRGLRMSILKDEMERVVNQLLQNEKQEATVMINEIPDGDVQVNGYIGSHDIHIFPATNDLIYTLYHRYKRSVDNIPTLPCNNCTLHIAYKPNTPEYLKTLKAPVIKSSKSKRSVPDTVYPEIMVVMDYPLFALWKQDTFHAVGYILAFWNSVDLRYRSLENPKYRLNIAGIIIATEPEALEFKQYTAGNIRDLVADTSLEGFGKWTLRLEQVIPNNHFDVIMTMTSDVFCSLDRQTYQCQEGTLGVAYVGGACTIGKNVITADYREVFMTNKVGLIHDKSGFEGINTAAHELGHLLGANHDGQQNRQCSEHIGNLMAPAIAYKTNSTQWSGCSIQDFNKYLNDNGGHCLYNKPKPYGVKELPRFLAGKLLDAQAQCERIFGKGAAVYSQGSTCTKLQCIINNYEIRESTIADGTACGKGGICIHGQCVDDSLHTYQ